MEPQRNIVLVINDLKGNGAERVVITLASGFIEAGHRASIVCFKRHIELPVPESIPVHIFSEKKFRWIPRRLRGLLTAPWLDRFIKKHAGTPDLVLSNLMPSDRVLAYSKLPGVHFIIHNTTQKEVATYYLRKEKSEFSERKNLYIRKPCICVSKGVENDLCDLLDDRKKHPITTIYNPVDVALINQAAAVTPTDIIPNAILHVGKFNRAKRQDRLIRAYHAIDSEYPLVFLGNGPLFEEMKALVSELGLKDRVHFLGFRKNPYPYIKAARLMVLCSEFEGLPTVLLEALALRTLAISIDCPSGPNEILPTKNLIKVDDHNGLEDLLLAATKQPDKYKIQLPRKFLLQAVVKKYMQL